MNKNNKNITKKNINQKNKNINEKNMNKENKGGKTVYKMFLLLFVIVF